MFAISPVYCTVWPGCVWTELNRASFFFLQMTYWSVLVQFILKITPVVNKWTGLQFQSFGISSLAFIFNAGILICDVEEKLWAEVQRWPAYSICGSPARWLVLPCSWLVIDLAEQTLRFGQSINQSSGGRRQPVLSVSLCVSDPCDFRMVFAVQPDPSGLNKLGALGARLGCWCRCPHCERLKEMVWYAAATLTQTCSGWHSLSLACLKDLVPVFTEVLSLVLSGRSNMKQIQLIDYSLEFCVERKICPWSHSWEFCLFTHSSLLVAKRWTIVFIKYL